MRQTSVQPELTARPAAVRSYVKFHQSELHATLAQGGLGGIEFARRHCRVMDGLIMALFQAASASRRQDERFAVAVGAVGGYGRGLLGWKSDLDLRVVTADAPEQAQALAEAILYPLWDAGVSIGHQVARVTDLVESARHDLPTATSVLDFRLLAGDEALGRVLEERAFAGIFSEAELPAFMERLEGELGERHKRFGDSIYLLEPDVKSGAGGLRDLDIALWATRARFRASSADDLRTLGVLSASEAHELEAAQDFLWTLRHQLHLRAGRRSDRLTFEEQEALAEALGYRARVAPVPGDDEAVLGAMVEVFMSDYYRHARVVLRLREQVMARSMPPLHRRKPHIVDLDDGVQLFNGQVTVTDLSELESDPALAFRLYSVAVERELPLLPFARDVVTRATAKPAFCEALRRSPEAVRLFVSLVSTPRRGHLRKGSILSELHDTGLLMAMIPEFLPVVGRVHHDVYHVYTVDVHSVAAVDFLRSLARGELAAEHPLASSLMAELTRPKVLYFATLLHDVGKAIGGPDHSQRGAEMAREILARLGFDSEDIEAACDLILQHLVMYRVAARRDLEDPATVSEFSHVVRGREGLRHLFLLTVADLSTTSPTSMTKWKRHMMDDLFRLADDALANASPGDAARLSEIRAAVRSHWGPDKDTAFLDEFLDSMPDGYLLSNGPEEIAWHATVAFQGQETVVTAAIAPSRHAEVAELCVVTGGRPRDPLCVVAKDRPGLLATIAAVITSNGFDVHAAQIHTRRLSDGRVQAMDLFWVTARLPIDDLDGALDKLRRDLEKVVTGSVAPDELMRTRRSRFSDRPVPAVATDVIFDNRASATHTLIEVVTKDRPGLLFTLARTMHELDLTIGVAKINTEGTRVLDVFYVTDLDGHKLDAGARADKARGALLKALHASPGVAASGSV